MIQFVVIEGRHKDPNDFGTLEIETKIIHGPFNNEEDAKKTAKQLIQQNIDNFYHRAWVKKSK